MGKSARQRIAILSGYPVFREGFVRIAERAVTAEFEEYADPKTAFVAFERHAPNLVVLDVGLADADEIEFVKRIKSRFPSTRVLAITMGADPHIVERYLRAGVNGYVLRTATREELGAATRVVLEDQLFVSRTLASSLVRGLLSRPARGSGPSVEGLTDRELQVFKRLGEGRSSREIARHLGLSIKTVESYRENIKRKMNLKNSSELVQRAMRWRRGDVSPARR